MLAPWCPRATWPADSAAQNSARCAAVRWHADRCPGVTSRSGGTSFWLRPPVWLAYRQRGWNGQPEGTLIRLGGVPGIGTSRVVRSRSMRGIEASSPQVYGWDGWPKMSTAVPYSTGRPAYITRMSSASSATTPRSWVMMMTAEPNSACRSEIRSRICACTVTSSAVVGSSAISSSGSLTRAIAIITRCRMPPENWCG